MPTRPPGLVPLVACEPEPSSGNEGHPAQPGVRLTVTPLSDPRLLVTSARQPQAGQGERDPHYLPLWGRHSSGISEGDRDLAQPPIPITTSGHRYTDVSPPQAATAPLTEQGA